MLLSSSVAEAGAEGRCLSGNSTELNDAASGWSLCSTPEGAVNGVEAQIVSTLLCGPYSLCSSYWIQPL